MAQVAAVVVLVQKMEAPALTQALEAVVVEAEAMEQVLTNESRIPLRITFLKPVSSAIAIGTGGPFGAEGPIIATGGALPQWQLPPLWSPGWANGEGGG